MNYDNYRRALKLLKFSANQSDVDALIKAHLDNPDEGTTKMALMDALMERDRHQEASLLQSGRPYYHWRGALHETEPAIGRNDFDGFVQHFARGYFSGMHEDGHQATDIHPATYDEMFHDARHFINSHFWDVIESGLSSRQAGRELALHRRGLGERFQSAMSPHRRDRLNELAAAAGPYTLEQGEDGLYRGKGGDHHWGQQPG